MDNLDENPMDEFWQTGLNKILIINKIDECYDPIKLKDLVISELY